MVRVARPRSRGWLRVLKGAPRTVSRRWAARPPGPESRSRLQRRMVACSRRRVASRQPGYRAVVAVGGAGAGACGRYRGTGRRRCRRTGRCRSRGRCRGPGGTEPAAGWFTSRLSRRPPVWLSRGPPGWPSCGPPGWPSCGPPGWPSCGPPGGTPGRPCGCPAGGPGGRRAATGVAMVVVGVVSQTVVSWSSTCHSCGSRSRGQHRITRGRLAAMRRSVRRSGPGRRHRRGPGRRSSTDPPGGGRRNSPRSMCTFRCGGLPVRGRGSSARRSAAGTPPRSRRGGARGVRVSSGPARCPQRIQHHRQSRRTPGRQIPLQHRRRRRWCASRRRRPLKPVAVRVGGAWARSSISRPSRARSCLTRATEHRREQDAVAQSAGDRRGAGRSSHRPAAPATPGSCPAASAAAITGCAPNRRAHPAEAAAAPLVTRVIARSHGVAP